MRCPQSYIDDIAEEQGHLFCIVAEKGYDLLDFIPMYAKTRLRTAMDTGIPWFCTRFGTEMYEWLVENDFAFKVCNQEQSLFVAEWLGVFYAYAQWYADISFEDLVRRLDPSVIISRYGALHDMDVVTAVKKILSSKLFTTGNIEG